MAELIVSVSGVRGIVGETLTPEVAEDFGKAFAATLGGPGKSVAIGRDSRPSGPEIFKAMARGLTASGVDVIDLGLVTTPGAAMMTRKLGCDGGVIITASHNPSQYNGIKFLQPTGTALTATMAEKLKSIWSAGQFTQADQVGAITINDQTHDEHIEAVCQICDPALIAGKKFKVALDSINGAGCIVTPRLLEKLGCDFVGINTEPTGNFAHEPEPIAQNLQQICEAVKSTGADIGFAQDPDADRLVLVDENGTLPGEEYTLALAAAQILRHNKGKLATNLSTSRMIDDIAVAAGAEVLRTPTGEANVVQTIQSQGCIFGGEGNGGVIDPRVGGVRDSLVGMALILQYMAETSQPLSELISQIPSYFMLKTKLPCKREALGEIFDRTRKLLGDIPGARLDESDGLRIDLDEGWVNVRGSNTEPIMRIMAEASDESTARKLIAQVRTIADEVMGN